MKLLRTLLLLLALAASQLALVSCTPTEPRVYSYRVVHSYPHDPTAFTQGLAFDGDVLYEGTGLLGQSALRRVDLTTGTVQQERRLAPDLFGEGVTVYAGRIVQLTWQSHFGYIYHARTMTPVGQFDYTTEGWGITQDGRHLIMSDGTATLYFLDPSSFHVTRRIEVHTPDGQPVTGLNELEYVGAEVYANVWPTDRIVRIAPATGLVVGWIDLTGLLGPEIPGRAGRCPQRHRLSAGNPPALCHRQAVAAAV